MKFKNMENVLNKLKIVEGKDLSVLIIDPLNKISEEDILKLNYNDITIAVENHFRVSNLIRKICFIKKHKIVTTERIPIMNYDIVLFQSYSDLMVDLILKYMKPKYMYFIQNANMFATNQNYYEIDTNLFKMTTSSESKCEKTQSIATYHFNNNEKKLLENISSNYLSNFENANTIDIKYNKYSINYLNEMVNGKVSVIMVISEANEKFADTLRAIRNQKYQSIEFIIIDNAAGFRNNVKPNIKYGEKMPYDFCVYHAKELTTGEFIFVLNQDSDEINILSEITKGHHETR